MSKAAAKTGSEPTVLSALEQNFPLEQRILVDDLAYRIQPAGVKLFIRLSKPFRNALLRASEKSAAPGMWGGLLCRKRFIDEKLLGSLDKVEQIVNLGAGLDTRLFRLEETVRLPAWELDQAANIREKQAVFARALNGIPQNRRLVAVDFDRESILAALVRNGFDPGKRTFFIWEAVTQYLTAAGIDATFSFLSKAASGSFLAFTYVDEDFIEGKNLFGWESGYRRFVKNKLFIYGMKPENVGGFCSRYGYNLLEDLDYSRMADRYLRPTGRGLTASRLEHAVFAEKT